MSDMHSQMLAESLGFKVAPAYPDAKGKGDGMSNLHDAARRVQKIIDSFPAGEWAYYDLPGCRHRHHLVFAKPVGTTTLFAAESDIYGALSKIAELRNEALLLSDAILAQPAASAPDQPAPDVAEAIRCANERIDRIRDTDVSHVTKAFLSDTARILGHAVRHLTTLAAELAAEKAARVEAEREREKAQFTIRALANGTQGNAEALDKYIPDCDETIIDGIHRLGTERNTLRVELATAREQLAALGPVEWLSENEVLCGPRGYRRVVKESTHV